MRRVHGFDLAAAYVAAQFRSMGLEPGGDKGDWYQNVDMVRAVREREGAQFLLIAPGKRERLRFQDEFLPGVSYVSAAV
ncbi:MAG: hypothetical protein IPK97_14370, partial [Ahniella sp.]|nr:hypothetical protein [Ahniella sp.]